MSQAVQDAMSQYSSKGNNLRNANFAFGFEDTKRQTYDQKIKSAAIKKNLYEYTKSSQENVSQWRHD